jgi:chromate transporter
VSRHRDPRVRCERFLEQRAGALALARSAASGPFVSLLRDSRLVAWLLDGVTVGAVALMAVVTWQLGRAAIMDVTTAVLAAGGAVLLLLLRLNSTWLIAAGAILGMIVSVVRAP